MKGPARQPKESPSLSTLIERIILEDHPALRERVLSLKKLFALAAAARDRDYPALMPLYALFLRAAGDLEKHMIREESATFPYFASEERNEREGKWSDHRDSRAQQESHSIPSLLKEHASIRWDWEEIEKAAKDFNVPEDASGFLKDAYRELGILNRAVQRYLDMEDADIYTKVMEPGP